MIEVTRGLEAGQRVMTAGQIKLDDGHPIIISGQNALRGAEPVPDEP